MIPALALWVTVASAHRPGLSYADLRRDRLVLTFARAELDARFPDAHLEEARDLLAAATLDKVQVEIGGQRCTIGDPTISAVRGGETAPGADPSATDGVALSAPLDCPGSGEGRYTAGFLESFESGHRHVLTVDGQPAAVLDRAAPTATFDGKADWRALARRFLSLGVEHIWTGYDHLLFLTGLLLVADRLRSMLMIVTGFTVAHSITLSVAALGVLSPPSAIVEPAIALTILFVGLENLWQPTPKRRVVLTFCLGLIHGFGFAGALREVGLPRDSLLLALLSFNGGVEVGQASVVALALPLLLLLRRWPPWQRRLVPALSIGVALAGLYWFVQRTLLVA